MIYKLKDICTLTKGAIGIMKAIPGKYPLVALSDERRSHNEFQFDAKAVIVPLISSTGHGHASMKRVHYQEGKFALGNILCAVIPKDDKQLCAKYLHLYLQQFKETLLVPLMKGAANVSLPMNKLGEVEIEVPSLQKQMEIISLATKASEYKDLLEDKLVSQSKDVTKLRQTFLREAVQGKLVKQNEKDGNATELLEKIKRERKKLGVKEYPLPLIKVEELPFDIPCNWIWSRLGEACQLNPRNKADENLEAAFIPMPLISQRYNESPRFEIRSWKDIKSGFTHFSNDDVVVAKITPCFENSKAGIIRNLPNSIGAGTTELHVIRGSKYVIPEFIYAFIKSPDFLLNGKKIMRGVAGQQRVPSEYFYNTLFPLPPLPEQHRIIKRIEKLMHLCDELQNRIQQSKIENEKLLQGVLRDALKSPSNILELSHTLEPEENYFAKRKILANYIVNQSLEDDKFGDVKFEKLLHLCEYYGIKRNLNQKYFKKAAGPFDNKFTYPYFQQIEKDKLFIRRKVGQQYVFKKGEKHSASEKYYNYFSDEEFKKIDKIINYFKTSSYEPAEIVSTLYAVWNNRIISGEDISDELLIADFYNWDTSKKRYKEERLHKALNWMRENEFVPDGWGNRIETKTAS